MNNTGVLCRLPSGRWGVCRGGLEPIEITSGDQFKIQVQDLAGKTWKLTRMEFSKAEGGYYSVDGYQLDQGMAVEFLGGRFSP